MVHLKRTLEQNMDEFRRVLMALPEPRPEDVETFRCLECEDTGWQMIRQEDGTVLARQCSHGYDGPRNFGFPPTIASLPIGTGEAASWVATHRPGDVVQLIGHPKRVLEVGLGLATAIAEGGYRPKYVSARQLDECPQGSLTTPVLAVGDVDGGLGAPKAKRLADVLRDGQGTVIIMGSGSDKWPRWDSYAMLNLALRSRDAREIRV